MTTDLYDAPDLYDLVAGTFDPAAEAFYLALARAAGSAVLELACGSGRLTVPMALAGASMRGLDTSAPMLAALQAKARAAGVAIGTDLADMRDFDLGAARFGLVFIPNNSLLHLHTVGDLTGSLRAASRHLAPGGRLAFDIFNPSIALLARKPAERSVIGRFDHPVHGRLTLEETGDYDAASQVNRGSWYWSSEGRKDLFVMPLHLRSIFPQELALLVQRAGLRLISRFGDFDGSAFQSSSRRQVCVCEVG